MGGLSSIKDVEFRKFNVEFDIHVSKINPKS